MPVTGLIGFNVLERFEVHFDYAAGELTLFDLDEYDRPVTRGDLAEPLQVTEFDMVMHLPVFPVRVGDRELRMGLDSGASRGMLFERWQELLEGQYTFLERSALNGADRNQQMGDVVRFEKVEVQDLSYPGMTFRFNDMVTHSNRPIPMDGLLGYEFLQSRPTSINYRRRELMVWPAVNG